jgi:hypothetical protein
MIDEGTIGKCTLLRDLGQKIYKSVFRDGILGGLFNLEWDSLVLINIS